MKMNEKLRRSLTIALRVSLLLYGVMLILFGLFSGAREGGWIANSPNALPGLALLVASVGIWIRPKLSAIVIVLWALAMGQFFSAWTNPVVLVFVVLIPLFWGIVLFILALRK